MYSCDHWVYLAYAGESRRVGLCRKAVDLYAIWRVRESPAAVAFSYGPQQTGSETRACSQRGSPGTGRPARRAYASERRSGCGLTRKRHTIVY